MQLSPVVSVYCPLSSHCRYWSQGPVLGELVTETLTRTTFPFTDYIRLDRPGGESFCSKVGGGPIRQKGSGRLVFGEEILTE